MIRPARHPGPLLGVVLIAAFWAFVLLAAVALIVWGPRPPIPGSPCGPSTAVCFHGKVR